MTVGVSNQVGMFGRVLPLATVPLLVALALATEARESVRHPDRESVATHVMTLGVTSAMYFCANGRWPTDVHQAIAFRRRQKLLREKPLDEVWAAGEEVSYRAQPRFQILVVADACRWIQYGNIHGFLGELSTNFAEIRTNVLALCS